MPTKYRKKPVVIEAMQYLGLRELANTSLVLAWLREHSVNFELVDSGISIVTIEGAMVANIDDWIIKGVKGEFYPCKPDIFEATYDKVEDDDGPLSETEMRSARGI